MCLVEHFGLDEPENVAPTGSRSPFASPAPERACGRRPLQERDRQGGGRLVGAHHGGRRSGGDGGNSRHGGAGGQAAAVAQGTASHRGRSGGCVRREHKGL